MARSANRIRDRVGTRGFSEKKKEPVATIWPCGDFSLGYRRIDDQETDTEQEYAYTRVYPKLEEGALAPLLDNPSQFSQPPKCAWPRRKYGLKGITSLGRKMVRSGAALIGQTAGDRNCSFLTLTVPPLPPEQRRLLAETWGETMRQLLQWLSRQLRRAGLPPAVVSVSEIQSKRLARSGEGYLHLHAIFPGRRSRYESWVVRVESVRTWWEKRLAKVTGLPSIPVTQVKMVPVKHTVAGYLSKYLSKGSAEVLEFQNDNGPEAVPGQWWNMTKTARDMVKGATFRGPVVGVLVESVVQAALSGVIQVPPFSIRHVEVEYCGRQITVGWCGYFKPKLLAELAAMLAEG